jgi:hypothetical protein
MEETLGATAAAAPAAVEAAAAPQGEAVADLPSPILPRRPQRQSVFVPLLLIILIPYAVMSTVAVVWLLFQLRARTEEQQAPPALDPFELLRDPALKDGGPKRIKHDAPLPRKLQTSLRQPLRVGDLEVTPLAVKRTAEGELVLKLKVKNVSRDVAFDPLPDSFLQYAPGRKDKPYTFVALGPDPDQRIYGAYLDKRTGRADGMLYPGKEEVVTLSTDPDYDDLQDLLDQLDRAREPILWRVQVRRGFVRVRGKDVSATAVVGVRLDPKDLPRPPDQRLGTPAFRSLALLPDPEFSKDEPRRVKHDAPLPGKLQTSLGQTLRVGDLEVKPLAAERTADGELLLKLRLRNISRLKTFDPLPEGLLHYDPAGKDELKPYTFLALGADPGRRIYGARVEKRTGRPDGTLRPGEQEEVTLATDPRYKDILERAEGQILWRVQVRRGFVQVDDRDVPATAVIGIRLNAKGLGPTRGEARLSPPHTGSVRSALVLWKIAIFF